VDSRSGTQPLHLSVVTCTPHAFVSEGGVGGGVAARRCRRHPPLICEREGVAVAVWRGWGGHALSHTHSCKREGVGTNEKTSEKSKNENE
jgi:hypothetical protein